ncbi:hypothetical protein ACGFNP_42905 [Nonomuraea sp. NPDC049269]|uniref:hypothetical protein n=1 Tax=Nonomuraea sp. NPDC049269 TaxID=3364349 RepID=UPI0037206522
MEITEDFDAFASRITRKLVAKLVALQGQDEDDVLAKIRVSKHLIGVLETQLRLLILHGVDSREAALLHEVLESEPPGRLHTWKEIGEALGVSAQAAQRKYGSASGRNASGGGAPAPG